MSKEFTGARLARARQRMVARLERSRLVLPQGAADGLAAAFAAAGDRSAVRAAAVRHSASLAETGFRASPDLLLEAAAAFHGALDWNRLSRVLPAAAKPPAGAPVVTGPSTRARLLAGIALVSPPLSAGQGTMEVSDDQGTTWRPLPGGIGVTHALVLGRDVQLRAVARPGGTAAKWTAMAYTVDDADTALATGLTGRLLAPGAVLEGVDVSTALENRDSPLSRLPVRMGHGGLRSGLATDNAFAELVALRTTAPEDYARQVSSWPGCPMPSFRDEPAALARIPGWHEAEMGLLDLEAQEADAACAKEVAQACRLATGRHAARKEEVEAKLREQDLIGRLLVHEAPPRMEFMQWWILVNDGLRERGADAEASWGETNWRYREHARMTPGQCADAIMADRARANAIDLEAQGGQVPRR